VHPPAPQNTGVTWSQQSQKVRLPLLLLGYHPRAMEPTVYNLPGLSPSQLFDLRGRVALVTGGAGGIGPWLAAGLTAAGARVLVTDRDAERLHDVAKNLKIDSHVADLTSDVEVADLMQWAGDLDILVNCAAVNRRKMIDEVEPEDFDAIVSANLRAPYFLSQKAARRMAGSGGGAIVHVGSINSAQGLAGVSVYGACKAALTQLTKVQSIEWASRGVRVNCLAPGFMSTPLSEPLWNDQFTAQWILSRVPQKRPGSPRELVGAMLLLASPAGAFITGEVVYVDGGFLAGSSWATQENRVPGGETTLSREFQ
jgi:NAD(P)-dependent dehydrogenase (short-subunit alcohol dehydrogenase family)